MTGSTGQAMNGNQLDRPTAAELLQRLRQSPPARLDEELAPEVDHDLLRALVRKELPPEEARLVYRLIGAFKSWDEAHTAMIVAEFRSRK